MLALAFAFAVTTYARPETIVSTEWVEAHLDDPSVRLVDMRTSGFATSHIPNAVPLANDAIRHREPPFVPTPAEFAQTMSALGISNATHVVVYDERGGIYAARLWWILNYYGHRHVSLVSGGWVKWSAEQRRVTSDLVTPEPATFTPTTTPRWLASAEDVRAASGKPGFAIVDARTPAEIEGRDLRGIRRGGAIPASIPLYWEDFLDPQTKAFRPAADLDRIVRERGLAPTDEIIAYCQVGMRASVDLFVLHLLGYDRLKNYYGAWEEWGNREDLPIQAPKAQ